MAHTFWHVYHCVQDPRNANSHILVIRMPDVPGMQHSYPFSLHPDLATIQETCQHAKVWLVRASDLEFPDEWPTVQTGRNQGKPAQSISITVNLTQTRWQPIDLQDPSSCTQALTIMCNGEQPWKGEQPWPHTVQQMMTINKSTQHQASLITVMVNAHKLQLSTVDI